MLDQSEIIKVIQDAIYTILIVAAPVLLIGMLVGTIVSIFQATTQINEQSLSFVPKIVAIFLTLILFGGWMLSHLTDFTNRLFEYIHTVIG
jgi:flagellar biosynthetic protein FliQ